MKGNSNSDNSTSSTDDNALGSGRICWLNLYLLLRPYVRRWVYNASVPSWNGQQEDVVDDIMQETMLRLLKYMKRAEKGEVAVVKSPEHMIAVIAHNCCRDWQRRDSRLVRFTTNNSMSLDALARTKVVDPAEIALDNVFRSWLFEQLSELLADIPDKQRIALLRDIAGRMYFGPIPSPLQKALADNGMEVQEYQDWKSTNIREQSQHASNLSISYHKITQWSKEVSLQ